MHMPVHREIMHIDREGLVEDYETNVGKLNTFLMNAAQAMVVSSVYSTLVCDARELAQGEDRGEEPKTHYQQSHTDCISPR